MARWKNTVIVAFIAVLLLAACDLLANRITTPTPAVDASSGTSTPAETGSGTITPAGDGATEEPLPTATPVDGSSGGRSQPLVAVLTPDGAVEVMDPATGEATLIAEPEIDIVTVPHRPVATMSGALFVLGDDVTDDVPAQVYSISSDGTVTVRNEFGHATRGLAGIVVGEENDYLAWGTFESAGDLVKSGLYITSLGANNTLTVVEQETPEGWNFVPVRWSEDGQRLYYAEEPSGLGGYILFDGYSSLYVYNMGSGESSVMIPHDRAGFICIDDISPDEQLVAHHCDGDRIAILDLTTGESTQVAVPGEVTDATLAGSAVFSPDGSQLAYGLARGNPEDERGYLAVTDLVSGESGLLATTEESAVYRVLAWVDAETLLVEQSGLDNTLWLVPVNGEPVYFAKGQFLALLPEDWLEQ